MVAFEDEPNVPEKRRIRYIDDEEDLRDVVNNGPPLARSNSASQGPRLSRTFSSASQLSIRSVRSLNARRSIDPALALPIQYRTLSYNIAESKEKQLQEAKAAKDKATEGTWLLVSSEWHECHDLTRFRARGS